MLKRLTTLALGAALAIGVSAASYAQIGGSSGGPSGNKSDDTSTMHGGTIQSKGSKSGTTGQGGPGASEYAPGRHPGTASEKNPGHGGTPPGQKMKMKKENEKSR